MSGKLSWMQVILMNEEGFYNIVGLMHMRS